MTKIAHVQDLQCAWLLLLYCASARANYHLRVVHPDLPLRKNFSVPKVAPLQASLSCAFPRYRSRGSTLLCFASSSCDVSGKPFPPLLASVGVAVFSTLLATTGQFALRQSPGIRFGKRCSSCRSTGHDERDGEGSGPCATRPGGRSSPASCGGRIVIVPWSATRPLHHSCFAAEAGRHTTTAQPSCGWGGVVACAPTK